MSAVNPLSAAFMLPTPTDLVCVILQRLANLV